MEPEAYKKNNKPETGGQPGVYKHPNTSSELHVTSFPQADALLRQGWYYDRELPKGESVQEAGAGNQAEVLPTQQDVERLEAELAATKATLKAERAKNTRAENAANKKEAEDIVERQTAQAQQDEARNKTQAKIDEANKQLGKDSK